MIEVRAITADELASAIILKIHCWQEELAGKVEHEFSFEEDEDAM